MVLQKLISILLVTVVLNPLCCCSAQVLSSNSPVSGESSVCAMGSCEEFSSSQEAPCKGQEDCPVRVELLQKQLHQQTIKTVVTGKFWSPLLLSTGWDHSVSFLKIQTSNPLCSRSLGRVATSLKLHQVNCVYLI